MSIISDLLDSLIIKVIASIVAPLLLAAAYYIFRRIYRAFQALRLVEGALAAVARREANGILQEGPGFWLKRPIIRPANYDDLKGNSIPILMIAATKGGVGKTSLAGSLAAHFALRWTQRRQDRDADKPLRVLVIDQDFQGSFTTMTVHTNNGRYDQPSKANRLVSGELANGGVAREAKSITQPGMTTPLTISTIPAYYDLAQAENRMLINWLLPLSDRSLLTWLLKLLKLRDNEPDRSSKDVRYLLAEALANPQVYASFDLVIIDSPPRLTTSHIQAMCASTHLLIPTILDGLSGDAVARYLDQIATHILGLPGEANRAICPHLQPIGVVCTLLPNVHRDLSGPLTQLRGRIEAARLKPDIVPEDCFIRQRTPYRDHAGERIAYAATSQDQRHEDLRKEVDKLGDWIAPRLGATAKSWKRRDSG
jgi:chromosome partitioning protein